MVGIGSKMNQSLHEWYHMYNESVVEYICIYDAICCLLFMMLMIVCDYVIVVMN